MWRTGSLAASLGVSALMAAFAVADCPDVTLQCPTGQTTTIGTCIDAWCTCDIICCPAAGCKLCDNSTAQATTACVNFWNQRPWECDAPITNRIDGCSGPLNGLTNEFFRVACNLHDICYHTPDKPRMDCELEFNQNLFALCAVPTSLFATCLVTAAAAFDAVVAFGQPSYDADQQWYRDHCFIPSPVDKRSWGKVKVAYR